MQIAYWKHYPHSAISTLVVFATHTHKHTHAQLHFGTPTNPTAREESQCDHMPAKHFIGIY